MTGSTPFSIDKSDNFQRSFKKLVKIHKVNQDNFIQLIAEALENLIEDQYPINSQGL
jgi:mRNA-degrading endonuclease YafQ of YafQ-DinJ toxin-antitoxin module